MDINIVKTIETNEGIASFEVTGREMGEYNSYVVVTDTLGNMNNERKIDISMTKMYTWTKWTATVSKTYYWDKIADLGVQTNRYGDISTQNGVEVTLNTTTGQVTQGQYASNWGLLEKVKYYYWDGKYMTYVKNNWPSRPNSDTLVSYTVTQWTVKSRISSVTPNVNQGKTRSNNANAYQNNALNEDWFLLPIYRNRIKNQ